MRVLLNCAVDANGHMAGPGGAPVKISSDADLRRVHRMRAEADAILVGVETVVRDDPSLRVNAVYATGPDPVPVVLDTHLRIPRSRRLAKNARTRIYHVGDVKLDVPATCVRVKPGARGVDVEAVLQDLESQGLRSLMVEGGSQVLEAFVKSGLWHQWTVFQSLNDVGDGPKLWGGLPDTPQRGMRLVKREETLGGLLWTFEPDR